MSEISPNQWTILERLEKGPEWIRSFQPAKPLLDDLIEKGLIERCRPHLGRGRNMVRLTEAGCEELEVAASDIPANRERAVFVDKPRSELGQIKPGISHKVRSVCERFVHAINGGEPQSDVIEQLAAAEDVQRPAIWKRLRMGGVIPDYAPRKDHGRGRPVGGGRPGYTERRRQSSLEARSEPPRPIVDRDPCPRCGVRGDIGCGHSHAPLRVL
jgi:DNA-binding MarR family transcriptional regulator